MARKTPKHQAAKAIRRWWQARRAELQRATALAHLLSDGDKQAISEARAEVSERFARKLTPAQISIYNRMMANGALPVDPEYPKDRRRMRPVTPEQAFQALKAWPATPGNDYVRVRALRADDSGYARGGGWVEDRGQRWTPKKRRG